MILLAKDSNLLKLPELLYGMIKRVGILNKEPILYGDVNLLKPGDLYYILGAKQVYRYIKAISTSNSEDQAEPISHRGLTKGGESELNPDPSIIDPSAPEDSSRKTVVYYFDTIRPLSENMTDGFVIPEEERGHIRNAGYLFNEIIYSGDANLIDNGSLFYHDTLPYISIVSNVNGTINLSTKELNDEGEITTVVTEYRVNPEHDYSKDYFAFEALENGTISFNIWKSMDTDMITSISYSTDNGQTWTTTNNIDNKSEHLVINVNVNQGDKVLWKGIATLTGYYDEDNYVDYVGSFFSSDCEFNAYGNIMSLLYGDNFYSNKNLSDTEGTFACLFYDYDENKTCEVVSAQNLILTATTLTDYCYYGMFQRCSSLTEAPELPATTLAQNCYKFMFYDCTSLTTAPTLPATTLANRCYEGMFESCTSLITAPVLPATTLINDCYSSMFDKCSKLNYIKAMFTTTPSDSYTWSWVNGVASTGTFVKNSAATWNVTDVNGIPIGWTVETAPS